MGPCDHKKNRRRIYAGVAFVLLVMFCVHFAQSAGDEVQSHIPLPHVLDSAQALPTYDLPVVRGAEAIRENPLSFLKQARASYDRSIRDYTCTFTKQELLPAGLSKEQISRVKFKEGPFSVYMHVVENPAKARRILYVKGAKTEEGKEMAVVQPEGAIARFLVSSVIRPVDGPDARQASRKTIDEFGFANSLDMIIRYADMTHAQGRLDLRYAGTGEVDGRSTHVIERRLPRHEDPTLWPDRLLVVHIDQEWLLPVAVYCYGDDAKTQLLGKYLYSDIELNVGLTESDFTPQAYGL